MIVTSFSTLEILKLYFIHTLWGRGAFINQISEIKICKSGCLLISQIFAKGLQHICGLCTCNPGQPTASDLHSTETDLSLKMKKIFTWNMCMIKKVVRVRFHSMAVLIWSSWGRNWWLQLKACSKSVTQPISLFLLRMCEIIEKFLYIYFYLWQNRLRTYFAAI